ncbi:UDP-glucosyltransferase 2-like [Achroia grisella]|uniref:UDP-glucosyltransferase 2-like n=1 Tax=Achroia grisella TaxID=688607 RepID=UPI0027D20CD2|nr:UDP-glucosyltransferase 2-like [Achroia grisella]
MIFLIFAILMSSVEAYNVLIIYSLPIRSIALLGEGHIRSLIAAGHEVTFITCYPLKDHGYGNKLRQIDVSNNMYSLPDDGIMDIGAIMTSGVPLNDVPSLQETSILNAISTFENEDVKKLLNDPNERFDVVISDLYETELFAAFAVVYNCPMIWSYSMGAQSSVLRLIDEPTNPAYTVDYLSFNMPPLTFSQRIQELWLQLEWTVLKRFSLQPKEEAVYEKYFGPVLEKRGRKLPNYVEIMYNASLIFGNEHHAVGNLPRTPQNFKFIGGAHIDSTVKPLPTDLQKLMDNSKHGVIYFSMGSTWQSKDIPKHVTEGLLKVFGELKQTVIWKYEEDLPNLPKNVHTLKWAPQHSILAHPNCLFFISHGGLLSSTEAIHFGVPTIGIPIYFDQFLNVNRAVSKGYAIHVPLTTNLPNDLKPAIQTMLTDSKYRKKIWDLSQIYHDRPVSPSAEVVHWVEHVIRTGGAPHLRSPALHVPFYQKYFLDLVAVLTVSISLVILLVKTICCKSSKTIQRKDSRKVKKK